MPLPKCPHKSERPSPSVLTIHAKFLAKLNSEDFGAIVTVIVGENEAQRTFHVYEGPLKQYSSYFRTALNGCWLESNERVVKLPQDEPEVFQVFFNYIMSGKLYARLTTDKQIPLHEALTLKVFIFGDTRGVPEVCNAAVDLLFQILIQKGIFPGDSLRYVYDNTPGHSLLRRFLVEVLLSVADLSAMETSGGQALLPAECMFALLKYLQAQKCSPGLPTHTTYGDYMYAKSHELCAKYHDHSGSCNTTATT